MPIILNWSDTNTNEDGHRVYRSLSAIDPQDLPAPLAELGADVTSYEDEDIVVNTEYHYRVSAYRGSTEAVSEELVVRASPPLDAYVAGVSEYSYLPAQTTERLISVPEDAGVGDLLVAIVGFAQNTTVVEPPGWTRQVVQYQANTLTILTKIAETGDLGSEVTFATSDPGTRNSAGQMLAVRGGAPAKIARFATSHQRTGLSNPIPVLTITQPGELAIAAAFLGGSVASTSSTGMSSEWTRTSPEAVPEVPLRLVTGWQKFADTGGTSGSFNKSSTTSVDWEKATVVIGPA